MHTNKKRAILKYSLMSVGLVFAILLLCAQNATKLSHNELKQSISSVKKDIQALNESNQEIREDIDAIKVIAEVGANTPDKP